MSTTVGRVDFTARIDGRRTPRDAENIGRRAGAAGAEGYDETWSKGIEETLTKAGQDSLRRWRKNGANDGTIYGREINRTMKKFLKQAEIDVAGLRMRPGFMDDFSRKFDDAGLAARDMQNKLIELNREGTITDRVFEASKRQVDDWVETQRKAAIESNNHRDAVARLNDDIRTQRKSYEDLTEELGERTNKALRENAELQKEISEAERRAAANAKASAREQKLLNNQRERHAKIVQEGVISSKKWDASFRDIDKTIRRVTDSTSRMTLGTKEANLSWSKIPHNGRQAILISAAVAGSFEQIATLGSGASGALGGLIGVLGSGIAGAGALGGAALAGFAWQAALATNAAKLMKDEFPAAQKAMTRLAESAENDSRAFARAWGPALEDFSNTLAGLWANDIVGERLGQSMAKITDAFTEVLRSPAYWNFQTAMETTIPRSLTAIGQGAASLTGGLLNIFATAGPELEIFAGHVSDFASEWEAKIQGMSDSGELAKVIKQMRESLETVIGFVGSLGSALSSTFGAGVEHGISMLETLTDLTDEWDAWTETVEGQKALEEWFSNGEKVFEGLLELGGEVGQMFAELVTPESVERTLSFLEHLGEAMEFVGAIGTVLGELDAFGLAAQLLADVGNALVPILEALEPIASIINTVVSEAITNLSLAIQFLTPLLLPLQIGLEFLSQLFEKVAVWMEPVKTALGEVGTALNDAATRIFESFGPAIDSITTSIVDMLPSPEEFAAFLTNTLIPAIEDVTTWIVNNLIPAIEDFAAWIENEAVPAAKAIWDVLDKQVIPILEDIVGAAAGAQEAFQAWSDGIKAGIDTIAGPISWAIDLFGQLFSSASSATNAAGLARSAVRGDSLRFASGGTVYGATRALIGEAGPEAVVPLNRPLSQVDPSVRWLSAIAQGKQPTQTMASGGVAGAGRTVNIEAGAIVVQGAVDPRATAFEVADLIAERIAS